MDDDLKQNLTAAETWVRGLFILLFAFFLFIARVVTGAVVMIQFLFTVFSGQTNDNLRFFGSSLAQFIYQTLMFLTYNSDDKPFPFSAWPEAQKTNREVTGAETDIAADIGADDSATTDGESEAAASSESEQPEEHEPRA